MNDPNAETPKMVDDWMAELASGGTLYNGEEYSDTPAGESSAAERIAATSLLLAVERSAMACTFEVLLNQHQYRHGTDCAVAALDLIDDMERILSIYKPRSDLSTLNRFGAKRAVKVSYDAHRLLRLAKDAHHWTEGSFDITAGALSEAWGFSRRKGRRPSELEIRDALALVGSQHLVVHDDETAEFTKAGMQVNPGGIGKGYALDRAASKLVELGIHDFMIHGGLSSIVAVGNRHNGPQHGWQVSLKHPWRWEQHLGTIHLSNQALGTSGSGKQFFHFGGQRYSHIVDPRTGWPAKGVMSVTVICPSAALADILATAFFVAGLEFTEEFCDRHQEVGAIIISQRPGSSKHQITQVNLPESVWTPA